VPYRVDLRETGTDVFERLVELGALDVDRSPDGAIAALLPDAVTPEDLARVPGVLEVSASAAIGRDADSVWVLDARPVQVGRLLIVPAHLASDASALRLIDSPAFGTGLHPTTVLCLEALAKAVEVAMPRAVLDVGTGSGVLALAALKLGVPEARGIDIDADALRTAADNARLNGFHDRLALTRGGPDAISGTWPLIVANVLAAPLVAMAPTLVQRIEHHGTLILSGIPTSVERDVDHAYRRLGMERVGLTSRGRWVALTLRASW
jgi:ribosomal protein L11 methyltransferase